MRPISCICVRAFSVHLKRVKHALCRQFEVPSFSKMVSLGSRSNNLPALCQIRDPEVAKATKLGHKGPVAVC